MSGRLSWKLWRVAKGESFILCIFQWKWVSCCKIVVFCRRSLFEHCLLTWIFVKYLSLRVYTFACKSCTSYETAAVCRTVTVTLSSSFFLAWALFWIFPFHWYLAFLIWFIPTSFLNIHFEEGKVTFETTVWAIILSVPQQFYCGRGAQALIFVIFNLWVLQERFYPQQRFKNRLLLSGLRRPSWMCWIYCKSVISEWVYYKTYFEDV